MGNTYKTLINVKISNKGIVKYILDGEILKM